MAVHAIYDPKAVGASRSFSPLAATFLIRDPFGRHTPGTIAPGIGGMYQYVKFGQEVFPTQFVMYDEMFGESRTPLANADYTSLSADDQIEMADDENGAKLVDSDFGQGAATRLVGLVEDVGAKKGEYGWVKVCGIGVGRIRLDGADDDLDLHTTTGLGCDEADGHLAKWATGARIRGIVLNTITVANNNTVYRVPMALTFPTLVRETATAGEDAQPDRSGFNTGASGSALESNA